MAELGRRGCGIGGEPRALRATGREGRAAHDMTDKLVEAGMPAYHSVAGAAKAISRYMAFLKSRNGYVGDPP